MKSRKGKFIDKKNAVTFVVVPPTEGNRSSGKSAKLRLVSSLKNNTHVTLPRSLAEGLNPDDLGFNECSTREEFEKACFKMYGYIPEALEKRYGHSTEPKTNFTMDELEASDCYFPLDGYNYEQHMCTRRSEYPEPLTTFPSVVPDPADETEKEVLEALNHPDEFEALTDEFILEIGECENERELLWGNYKPLFPEEILQGKNASERMGGGCIASKHVDTDEADNLQEKQLNELLREEYDDDEDDEDGPPHYLGQDGVAEDDEDVPDLSISDTHQDMVLLTQNLGQSTSLDVDVLAAVTKNSMGRNVKVPVDELELVHQLTPEEREIFLDLISTQDDDAPSNLFDHEWFKPTKRNPWDCQSILSVQKSMRQANPQVGPTLITSSMPKKQKNLMIRIAESHDIARISRLIRPPQQETLAVDQKTVRQVSKRISGETLEQKKQRKAETKELQREARKKKKQLKSEYKQSQQLKPLPQKYVKLA